MFETYKEAFDATIQHMNRQGRRAKDDTGLCSYRLVDETGNTLYCNVGRWLNSYNEDFEGLRVSDLFKEYSVSINDLLIREANTKEELLRFWGFMQQIHDCLWYKEWDNIQVYLKRFFNIDVNLRQIITNWEPLYEG